MTPTTRTTPDPDSLIPTTDDPGGAHAKGFSAEPGSANAKLPDPIPLSDAPTGRSEPTPYDPNDQIVSGG